MIPKSWIPDETRLAKVEVQEALKVAQSKMGYNGRMMSGSKSGYQKAHKANVVVFNGNLCTKEFGKIWYGDMDLTLDLDKIKELSTELKVEIFVLREMDARFDNENTPDFSKFVVAVNQEEVTIGQSLKSYSSQEDMVEISKSGKLKSKLVYKKEHR
jgi:hypothetical protein